MKKTHTVIAIGLAFGLGAGCTTDPYGGGYDPKSGDCPPGLSCPDGGVPPALDSGEGGGDGGGNGDGGGGNGDGGGGNGDGGGTMGGDGGVGTDGGGTMGGDGGVGTDGGTGPTVKTVRIGAGVGVTPFDIKGDGSGRVKLDDMQNVVIDRDGVTLRPRPLIWIANSGNGTESKIDTRTYKQLARYCTYPGCNGDPSRSTVGISGNVLVTNRANYYGVNDATRASAVLIAGDKTKCVDRNGNGVIDTYEGEGDPKGTAFEWKVGQAQSPDECVLWKTQLTKDRTGATTAGAGTLPRAAAFDAVIDANGDLQEYIYVGLYGTRELVRLDAKDGKILKQFDVKVTPYGAVIDRLGRLWVRGSVENNFARVDIRTTDAVTVYGGVAAEVPPCPYGISADSRGYIYTAGATCVARFNPADPTKGWEKLELGTPACFGRGLGLDSKFNLWVADTCAGIYHVDASKAFGLGMTLKKLVSPRGVGETNYYLGVGIDVDEHPWVVSEGRGGANLATPPGGTSIIYHVDPVTYITNAVATGQNSYTYSDMTGAQLRLAGSPTGLYVQTLQGVCSGLTRPRWTEASWTIVAPAGTSVDVKYRTAEVVTDLKTAPTTDVPAAATLPFPINVKASYLQLSFSMRSDSVDYTPTLRDITVKYICE